MAGDVTTRVDGRTLSLSNLDKVLYPETGYTKAEVIAYYSSIASVLLPHISDRALTRVRFPDGVGEQAFSFYEKNAPLGTPDWVRRVTVGTSDGLIDYVVADDQAAVVWLANLAALELHVHQWTVGRNGQPRNPNRLVIDLDPGEPAGLPECCRVALLVRDRLADRGLGAAPVLSGSKGLHLYAGLPGRLNPDETTALAKEVAEELQAEHPKLVTATMTKAKRSGKVFLDWSQNAGSKTTISPYSLRGRETPYVAAPVTWDEVDEGADDPLGLEQMRFETVLERASEHGDLFA
jgi:bifunctional non-homologous end joining protein LigD